MVVLQPFDDANGIADKVYIPLVAEDLRNVPEKTHTSSGSTSFPSGTSVFGSKYRSGLLGNGIDPSSPSSTIVPTAYSSTAHKSGSSPKAPQWMPETLDYIC